MSPVVALALMVITLIAILVIWQKLGPYPESLCTDYGFERFYHSCAGVMPVLITIGIIYSAASSVLTLVLKAVVK
jgi:hypothetical protein